MKLIDLDAFYKFCEQSLKCGHEVYPEYYDDYLGSDMFTVKAIPIEWLHSIMEKQLIFAMKSEMEGTTTVKDGVIHCVSGALACQVLENVIELWEKENEKDI